eukprot:1273503-Karenia_brevis.AAC.1
MDQLPSVATREADRAIATEPLQMSLQRARCFQAVRLAGLEECWVAIEAICSLESCPKPRLQPACTADLAGCHHRR